MLSPPVNHRWHTLRARVTAAGGSPSEKQLHRIRIAAKNLRYASELSQPVIGKPAARTAKLAENIQTVLGDYHDASTAIEWCTQAGKTGPGRAGFAAGVLTAEQDHRRKKLAKKWWRRWAKLSQPSARQWLS
jgi:CHAD domain-containing protein